MADEHVPDGFSSDPADDPNIDAATEEELDALLAEASALAAEVSGEVGLPEGNERPRTEPGAVADEAPETPRETTPATATPAGLAGPDDVEAQLSELEGLLANAQADVGVEAGPSEEPALPPDSGFAASTSLDESAPLREPSPDLEDPATPNAAVPSFREEFTQPEQTSQYPQADDTAPEFAEESTSPEEPAQPAETGSAIPEFMKEFTQPEAPSEASEDLSPVAGAADVGPSDGSCEMSPSVVSARPGLVSSRPRNGPETVLADDKFGLGSISQDEDEETGTVGPTPVATAATAASGKAELVRRLVAYLSPPALKVCARGVGLLEVLDKPFGRLGSGGRRALGWLAIATLGTSLIVLLVSLL